MSAAVRRLASCVPSEAVTGRRASCGSLDVAASLSHLEGRSRERCSSIGPHDFQNEKPSLEYLQRKRPSLDPSWLTPRTQATFVDALGSPFLQLLKQSSLCRSQEHVSATHSTLSSTPKSGKRFETSTPITPHLTTPFHGKVHDSTSKGCLSRRRHTLQYTNLGTSPKLANARKCSAPSLAPFPALSPCLENQRNGRTSFSFSPRPKEREYEGSSEDGGEEAGEKNLEEEALLRGETERTKGEGNRRGLSIPWIRVCDVHCDETREHANHNAISPENQDAGLPSRTSPDVMGYEVQRLPTDILSCSSIFPYQAERVNSRCNIHAATPTKDDFSVPTPRVGAVLGRGGFGTVKVGCYKGTRVAVKVMKGRRAASSATQEANLLPVRPHAHVTSTYAVVTPATTDGFALVTWANKEEDELREALLPLKSLPSMFTLPQEDLACPFLTDDDEEERDGPLWAWVVNELCTPRTLLTLINDTNIPIHDRDKVRYIREIASGLSYLHSQGIVHRDVKPANALLHSDGHLRLADFGCSSRPGQDEVAVIGTVPYQAPEVLRGGMGCERSDVFSLGITTWHLLTRRSPYEGLHHHVVLYQVTCLHQRPQDHRAYDPPNPSSLSQTEDLLFRLAGKCWAEEPQERPDAASLCRLLSALLCSPTI